MGMELVAPHRRLDFRGARQVAVLLGEQRDSAEAFRGSRNCYMRATGQGFPNARHALQSALLEAFRVESARRAVRRAVLQLPPPQSTQLNGREYRKSCEQMFLQTEEPAGDPMHPVGHRPPGLGVSGAEKSAAISKLPKYFGRSPLAPSPWKVVPAALSGASRLHLAHLEACRCDAEVCPQPSRCRHKSSRSNRRS
ncbi:hypothetical protein D3C87_1147700 [compost metagenome]